MIMKISEHLRAQRKMLLPTYTNKELERIYLKISERITGWKWRRFENVGIRMRTAREAHPHLYYTLVVVNRELNNRILPNP